MKSCNKLHVLVDFFNSLKINEEASLTEVNNFLQNYLEYIFELNNIDITKYDIQIKTIQIGEYHSKREKQFKYQPNKEDRFLDKRKALTKNSYKANCGDHYFDAIMSPDKHINNKFNILINKTACYIRNFKDINNLVYLIFVFGHEAHHIIQYIKHKQEMYDYDYSLSLHDAYFIETLNNNQIPPRQARKIKRAINRHLDKVYFCCSPEKHASKKGYDYLDILFNEILKHNISDDFKNFIETLKELLEYIYKDYLYRINLESKDINSVNKKLKSLIDDDNLITIN